MKKIFCLLGIQRDNYINVRRFVKFFESFAWRSVYVMEKFWVFLEFFKLIFFVHISDCHCQQCRFVRVVGMEFGNKFLHILDILDRLPGVFFSGVSFPVYQILDLSLVLLGVSNFFDIVLGLSFNIYMWWGRRFLLIVILCGSVWEKVNFIKDRVNGWPGIRKFEFVGRLT